MKKKNKLFLAFGIFSLVFATAFVVGTKENIGEFARAETKDTYSVVLNKSNQLTSAEQSAGSFIRNTSEGNPISFTHEGAQFYESTGFFQTRKNGAYIANSTPINGITSVKVYTNDAVGKNRTYSILFGTAAGEFLCSSGDIVGNQSVQEYKVPRYETPFSYFKLQATTGDWTHFISVEVVYSCSNSLAVRGKTFAQGVGGTVDLKEAVPVDTGTINVDIKWTDLGADKGKTAIGFFNKGWAKSFGYKTVYQTTKTGAIAGLTVTQLSDGYTRFSWKLSEMTGSDVPTDVSVVHIHNNATWTTCSGYFDVNSDASVVEFKGEKFIATDGLNIDLALPVSLATGKIQVDLYFTSVGKVTFAVMDDWDGNYYGYFDISTLGNNASVYGLEVVSQANGFVRFTFEASKISSSKKQGTPTEINMIYIRAKSKDGGYTTANGYMDVSVVSY